MTNKHYISKGRVVSMNHDGSQMGEAVPLGAIVIDRRVLTRDGTSWVLYRARVVDGKDPIWGPDTDSILSAVTALGYNHRLNLDQVMKEAAE